MLFGAFPVVFQQTRGWSPGISGLAFLGVLVGFMLALVYTVFYENPRYSRKLDQEGGWLPPEQRLLPSILGGCLLPIVSIRTSLQVRFHNLLVVRLSFVSMWDASADAIIRAFSPLHGPRHRLRYTGSHQSSVQPPSGAAWS